MAESFKLETEVFERIPHAGRTLYDKALLGRIGDKKVSGEEKDIAKHVPYNKKNQYIGSRVLTNPLAMGAGMAGFAALFHKYRPALLEKAFKQYKHLEKKKDPVAKVIRHALANQLKDPETGTMMKSLARVKQVTTKTPAEIRKSVILSGAVAGGATALGRYLHPRALKGEAIMEKELYHQKNPTEYIRTKLREDVALKRGQGVIKSAAKKSTRGRDAAAVSAGASTVLLTRIGAKTVGRAIINTIPGTHTGMRSQMMGWKEPGTKALIAKVNRDYDLRLGKMHVPDALKKPARSTKFVTSPHYNPMGHVLTAPTRVTAAHELGHAAQTAKWNKLTGSVIPGTVIAVGEKLSVIPLTALLSKKVTTGLAGKDEDSKRYKTFKTIEKYPELVGASMVGPRLVREGGASLRGLQYLKKYKVNAPGAKKLLAKAFATYLVGATPIMAGTAVMGAIRRKNMEKGASKKKDSTALAVGAGIGAGTGVIHTFTKPSISKRTHITKAQIEEFKNKLKPGDVLLEGDYKHDAWGKGLQTTIRRNHPEYHVGINTGNGEFAELLIKDTKPSVNTIGKDLDYALRHGSHVAYRPRISDAERTRVVENVKKKFPGYTYSTSDAARVWLQRKVGLKRVPCKGKFCSNSVADVLPRRLFGKQHPSTVLPHDFAKSKNFQEVARLRARTVHLPLSNKSIAKYIAVPAVVAAGAAWAGKQIKEHTT